MSVVLTEEISVKTGSRNELVDITDRVKQVLSKSGADNGTVYLYVPHTTAAVAINENYDPSVKRDIIDKLSELVPAGAGYSHAEGNADSHIKSTVVGTSEYIPFENGRLKLGRWQGIFFCEFDGSRSRRLIVQISD